MRTHGREKNRKSLISLKLFQTTLKTGKVDKEFECDCSLQVQIQSVDSKHKSILIGKHSIVGARRCPHFLQVSSPFGTYHEDALSTFPAFLHRPTLQLRATSHFVPSCIIAQSDFTTLQHGCDRRNQVVQPLVV